MGRCEECKFWERYEGNSVGLCRRFPPVPFSQPSGMGENRDGETWISADTYYEFPETKPDDWCGEFKIREG